MGQDEAWVKETLERNMSEGDSRESAFHRFRTENGKAIVEWEAHLQSIRDRNKGVIPKIWRGVYDSVVTAIEREKQALKDADELEASVWKR
jgi:hypothetical protein